MAAVKFEAGENPVEEKANGRAFQGGLTVADALRTPTELDPETVEVLSP